MCTFTLIVIKYELMNISLKIIRNSSNNTSKKFSNFIIISRFQNIFINNMKNII